MCIFSASLFAPAMQPYCTVLSLISYGDFFLAISRIFVGLIWAMQAVSDQALIVKTHHDNVCSDIIIE